jgi:hypothetical protein
MNFATVKEKLAAVYNSDFWKKTVTVPTKLVVLGSVVLLFFAVALALSHHVEPHVNHFLGFAEKDDNAVVLQKLDALDARLSSVAACKPDAPVKKASK